MSTLSAGAMPFTSKVCWRQPRRALIWFGRLSGILLTVHKWIRSELLWTGRVRPPVTSVGIDANGCRFAALGSSRPGRTVLGAGRPYFGSPWTSTYTGTAHSVGGGARRRSGEPG